MIAALSFTTHYVFSRRYQDAMRERVLRDSPPAMSSLTQTWRERARDKENYRLAARFTIGDLTMLRKELLAGFVVAGFLMSDVPNRWWSHLFVSGHGIWTVLENVAIAPVLAVISFVCSVGNIPLAAALWAHGVAFGGVISFIFADLVTLPLLFIYRRFYGTRAALRLFGLFWFVMSASGLVVDRLFHLASLVPSSHHTRFASGNFALGWTLALNIVATGVLVTLWFLARNSRHSTSVATDPICGMAVNTSAPGATRHVEHVDYYFCSPGVPNASISASAPASLTTSRATPWIRTEYGATLGGSRPTEPPGTASPTISPAKAVAAFLSGASSATPGITQSGRQGIHE